MDLSITQREHIYRHRRRRARIYDQLLLLLPKILSQILPYLSRTFHTQEYVTPRRGGRGGIRGGKKESRNQKNT
ncbi:hypothetical protein MTTB_p150 (plasmid) [Methanothermobacter tenebrarum]|uniref:Uncharacterized protein n=1 Tax=Methanothermobacter tenebrarum TaxID=680118 RepID=A0ABM7YFT0_9EURY|nr:hypothetical protein MTTB_p150 [Methanothermobacter tenebrarum]